jgi:hypothetical protein
MQPNLYELIFEPIKNRVIQQKDSLDKLKKFNSSIGFEAWLKVEAIYALNSLVDKVGNKGSDLILKNDLPSIELKASTDNLTKNYFTNSNNEFYSDPVLFIAGRGGKTLSEIADENSLTIIGEEVINDRLMIGFVKRSA